MTTEITQIIPAHVHEFLKRNDAMSKGISVIGELENEADFIRVDEELEATEKTAAILRGFLYMHFRDMSDSRTFSGLLAQGISRSTAYDYIEQATVYAELPNAEMCATVAQLGHSKTRLLKSIPKAEREGFLAGELINGTTIDDAAQMTKAEFKDFVRDYQTSANAQLTKAQQENAEYKMRLETAQHELEQQKQESEDKYSDVKLPAWAIAIREEGAVHGEMALQHIAGLDKTLNVLKTYDQAGHDSPEQFADYRAAAAVAFYSIANVMVQAHKALQHAKTFLGEEEVGEFDYSMALEDVEADKVQEIIAMLNAKLNADESVRVSSRIAKQGRVGAPKKNPKAFEDEL